MSRAVIALIAFASSLLVAEPALHDNGAALMWNASASVPIGLYRLAPARPIEVGDLAVVVPPTPLAELFAERGYLPRGVPLVKRVLALAGTKVCRTGLIIVASGHVYGTALERDSRGRPLPVWEGCRTLADGEVFLMNSGVADSLDSRYFGPLPVTAITARALAVFTDDDGDGRFHWHVGDSADVPRPSFQPPAKEPSHGTDR